MFCVCVVFVTRSQTALQTHIRLEHTPRDRNVCVCCHTMQGVSSKTDLSKSFTHWSVYCHALPHTGLYVVMLCNTLVCVLSCFATHWSVCCHALVHTGLYVVMLCNKLVCVLSCHSLDLSKSLTHWSVCCHALQHTGLYVVMPHLGSVQILNTLVCMLSCFATHWSVYCHATPWICPGP